MTGLNRVVTNTGIAASWGNDTSAKTIRNFATLAAATAAFAAAGITPGDGEVIYIDADTQLYKWKTDRWLPSSWVFITSRVLTTNASGDWSFATSVAFPAIPASTVKVACCTMGDTSVPGSCTTNTATNTSLTTISGRAYSPTGVAVASGSVRVNCIFGIGV